MRILEVLLITLLLVAFGLRFLPSPPRWGWAVTLLALAVTILHVVIEQPRWQMVPVYALVFLLSASAIAGWGKSPVRPALGWTIAGSAALVVFSLPPILFPVPRLTRVTGPYPVGTTTFYWVDPAREETLAGIPAGKRRIMVQVWYPAAPGPDAQPAPYMDDLSVGGPAVAHNFNLPPFALSHLGLAETHAYLDVPLAGGAERYPVLVFSHGWTGFRMQNTFQVEELASHGYVVFAPDHTYGAAVTTFPDGTSALNRPELLPKNVSDEEYAAAARLLGQAWVGDIRFVLNQVEKLEAGQLAGPFQGRLDLGRVGIFGHSTGGGAAVETCYSDSRCKAGLAMDAWMVPYAPEIPQNGLRVPFFFFQSEQWPDEANALLLPGVYEHMKAPAWRLTIEGTKHYNFSDIALLTPLASALGITGPIDGDHELQMVNAYTVAFFDATLRGQPPSPLLNGPNPAFPEIRYEIKQP